MCTWGKETSRQRRGQCKDSKAKFAWCVYGTIGRQHNTERVRGGVIGDVEGDLTTVRGELHTGLCGQF